MKVPPKVKKKPTTKKLPRGHGKKGYYPERGTLPLADGELARLNLKLKRRLAGKKANAITKADPDKIWMKPFAKRYQAMEVVTTDTTRLVRLVKDGSNNYGSFYARLEDIKDMTGQEVQRYLNLAFVPTHYQHVTIPKGQRLYVGTVGKQLKLRDGEGKLLKKDGGLQFQIKLDPGDSILKYEDWFSKSRTPLKEL